MQVHKPLPALTALLFLPSLLPSGALGNPIRTQVWVDPPNSIIPVGSSVVMNCSTDCYLSEMIGLETRLAKVLESNGTNWITFRLSNVTQDNSPLCFANCPGKVQGSTRANIMVYEQPKNVELNLEPSREQSSLPWIPVGQNFTLSCHVTGGRPRENLQVVLLRGAQEISRQSAPKNTLDTVIVKFQAIASREDNEANFSCHTKLDLRPRGLELYENSSALLTFHTFALAPEPPVLKTPKLLEAGTKKQVTCEMGKVFPVEKAQIQLSWGGQRLTQPLITRLGDVLRATATIMGEEEEEGDRELTCIVSLGNETWKVSEDVTVYTFPQPRLIVREPIQEGNQVNLTCEAQPPAQVLIKGAPPHEPDRISLIVQEKDNGRLFTCQAIMELREERLSKNSTLKLNVLFPPKLEKECPEKWNWSEGAEETLQCTARGNPAPIVKCVPQNQEMGMPLGIPQRVIRAYNGTYRCTAKNSLGEVSKVVSVVVEFQDVNPLPIIISILVILAVVSFLSFFGYLYYRKQRIRSYELKKAQEARAMKLISPEAKHCP